MLKKGIIFISFMFIFSLAGISAKFYRGPFHAWVRNYFVDIIAVMFLAFLIKVVSWGKINNLLCAFITLISAVIIESSQLVKSPFLLGLRRNFFISIIIGQSFDVWDFLYYLIGVVLAYFLLEALNSQKILKRVN